MFVGEVGVAFGGRAGGVAPLQGAHMFQDNLFGLKSEAIFHSPYGASE